VSDETIEQRAWRLYHESGDRLDKMIAQPDSAQESAVQQMHSERTRIKVLEEVLGIEDEPTD
jgi:hypothetical protein